MKLAFFADEHFRSTVPVARTDEYLENQHKLILWLGELSKTHTIITSGDTVHHARERAKPLDFANYLIKYLPHRYGVLGNHDLLYHNRELLDSTTMGNLINAGKFTVIPPEGVSLEENLFLYGYSYGDEIKHLKPLNPLMAKKLQTHIAVYHGYVSMEENPMIDGKVAKDILKEFPEYDIILTGDNHQGFIVIDDGRVLINPGSIKKDNADQMEHTPTYYTYDTVSRKIDYFAIPDFGTVLVRDYLEKEEIRNKRLDALGEKFEQVKEITLDFEENLNMFCEHNNVNPDVHARVLEWMQ